MKTLPLAFILAILLLCCSKPAQENTQTATSSVPANQPPIDQAKIIELTPEEMEQVHQAIFLRIHEFQMFFDEPGWTAFKEEYTFNDNNFSYALIRNNKSPGVYADPYSISQVWQDPRDYENSQYKENISDDEPYGEGAGEPYGEAYGESTSPDEEESVPVIYINEYDTLSGSGNFVAILESEPEAVVKTVRIRINGATVWQNYYYDEYDERKRDQLVYLFHDLVIELGTPLQLSRDKLYLKAKIFRLSDADLAGMSKDELGYLRNEIFARHGHTFKTDKMKNFFMQKDWYFELVDDAATLLNEVEKKNVEFIKTKEG